MDYKEFLKEIRRRIQEKVDGEVRAETIKKNNSVNMDGLLIQEKGQNILPVIYLNPYYRSYLDGRDMERIADDIYRCYLKNKPADDFDISCFTDFEQVKSRIVYRLVNYEKRFRIGNIWIWQSCSVSLPVIPEIKGRHPSLSAMSIWRIGISARRKWQEWHMGTPQDCWNMILSA